MNHVLEMGPIRPRARPTASFCVLPATAHGTAEPSARPTEAGILAAHGRGGEADIDAMHAIALRLTRRSRAWASAGRISRR